MSFIERASRMNNSAWIIDGLTEWLKKSAGEIYLLQLKSEGSEKDRLTEKLNTLKTVFQKLEELKNE